MPLKVLLMTVNTPGQKSVEREYSAEFHSVALSGYRCEKTITPGKYRYHFRFILMASTLDIISAERAAQDAEEARPPFVNVNDIRTFIATECPAASDNVTLEMCWLGAKEFDRGWHAELLNRDDEEVFEVVEAGLESIDRARRSKCVFALTIWKNRDDSLNILNFRKGFSYRFEKVHSLKLSYGNPVGSMQIRGRLGADHLPVPGSQVEHQSAIQSLAAGGLSNGNATNLRATAEQALTMDVGALLTKTTSQDLAPKTPPIIPVNAASVAKAPSKSRARKLEGGVGDAETTAGLLPMTAPKKARRG
ncbi:hypothetical protein DVH05_000556 [Phytophthora capsici]|nr:hypothetical protein DVH05_000556 [Phytophthora capsici]